MEKIYTKIPMQIPTSVRLLPKESQVIIEAARLMGLSRSEFLRRSGIERAKRVLRRSRTEGRLMA